jgi:hypothetical protein
VIGDLALADDFHKNASLPAFVEFAAEGLFPRGKKTVASLRQGYGLAGQPSSRGRDYGLAGE